MFARYVAAFAIAVAPLAVSPPLAAAQAFAWRIADRPRVDLGGEDADSTAFFSRIPAAFRLRDGRIAVAESDKPPTIRYFSPEGRFLHSYGRRGGGPGEFQAILSVFRTTEDTLVVHDPWQARFTYITPAGKLARVVSGGGTAGTPGSMQYYVVGRFNDGTLLARNNVIGLADRQGFNGPPTGPRRDSIPWFRLREDGTVVDTLTRAPGELYDRPASGSIRVLRLTPRPAVLAADGMFFIGTGESFTITAYDLSGRTVQVFTKPHRPARISAAVLSALEQQELEALSDANAIAALKQRNRTAPSASVLPAHDRFLLRDPEGNLWVQDFLPPGAPRVVWSVFAPDGGYRGVVNFPPRFRPLDIGRDYVLGSWTDDLGALHVQLYDLRKGGT
jgi:hypothetical protein